MPKISVFKNVSEVENPIDVDIFQYLEDTRDGMWEDIVTQCRNIKDEADAKLFKSTMPTATLSGVFPYRSDAKIKEHSGYIAIDIDDIENPQRTRAILAEDKYVFSVFLSTRANGLRVLFKIVPEKHRESFRGIVSYLYEKYSIVCDRNGINISKPYIVSFDPQLYINYDNVPIFKKYVKEIADKPNVDFVHTEDDFLMVMKQIVGRGINICESYNDWLKVGFAISEQFGQNGLQYFHDVSSVSLKYKKSNTDKQYKYCLSSKGTSKVTISSFYYLAKSHGIDITSERTKTITRITRTGKRSGLSKESIIKNLKENCDIDNADELVSKIFDSPNIGKDDDEEESILHNLEMFIDGNYKLKMNEVTGYLEQSGVQLTPYDLNSMFISAKKAIPKLDYQLMMRLLKSDFIEVYNPFYKFFSSDGVAVNLPPTPEKDQNSKFKTPLIDILAKTIINDNPAYTLYFLRKWIVSIVSAAHKVHSPLLFCLLGGQNTGKTEWFRRLLPPELRDYYAESKLDKEKDDELLMTENIVIMDDELGGKSKKETIKLNNITSKDWFSIRRPYGDHNEKLLRLAVLCGTSNYMTIINDPTGNRRIIPIVVNDIDKELYNSIDKRQLFLEAFRVYKEGFDWRITMHDINYLNKDIAVFEATIKERELIQRYYEPGNDSKMTTTDICVELELLTRQRVNSIVVGRELITLGYERRTVRDAVNKNITIKKWFVNKIGRGVDNGDSLPF